MSLKKIALASLVSIVMISSLSGSCSSGTVTTTATAEPTENWYQTVADDLRALLPDDPPSALINAKGVKDGTEFDVNAIFQVLTHISLEEGYVLDYVYLTDGSAGGPILYVRKTDRIPFTTYEDYKQATHDTPKPESDLSMIWLVKGVDDPATGNKIRVENSEQGFYEYALFQTLANQFYLLGGARINDKSIITGSAQIEKVLTEINQTETYQQIDDESEAAARKLDSAPIIRMLNGNVELRLTFFSKWQGFYYTMLTIKQEYPNTVTAKNESLLVAYNCGVLPNE